MKIIQFSIEIDASREKVWKALWEDENYRYWTSPFMEGSYALSDWKEGSRIHFLAPGGEGMYSTIDRLIPNEHMSFRHIGMIKNGKELPVDEETKKWSGAMENYTLEERGGKTQLTIDVDSEGAEWEKMLFDAFPIALDKLKEIAEK